MIRVYKYLIGITIKKAEKLFSPRKNRVIRSNEITITETI